jgi:EXLDI family protein
VPNKTIYVSDGDLPVYQRAQELAGGNLSSAITTALRRYVDLEEGRLEGFKEITVRVGPKGDRKKRFNGVLLGEWGNSDNNRAEMYRVYGTRTGKFVLHVQKSPEWEGRDADGNPAGWRSWLGLGNYNWTFSSGESSLEVFESVEQLREKVPPQLDDMVAASARQTIVEDLDI